MRSIPGFQGYFIDRQGNVYSLVKRHNQPIVKTPRPLCVTKEPNGYKSIRMVRNGQSVKKHIHVLLLETFVSSRPLGHQCRHLDGNKGNNDLDNLRWGTVSENQMDRVFIGNDNRGERHGMSKLTWPKVDAIRRMATALNPGIRKCDMGGGYKEIGDKFDVSASTVGGIVRGERWRKHDPR